MLHSKCKSHLPYHVKLFLLQAVVDGLTFVGDVETRIILDGIDTFFYMMTIKDPRNLDAQSMNHCNQVIQLP